MAAESGAQPAAFGRPDDVGPRVRRAACRDHGIDWQGFDRLLHALPPRPEHLQLRRQGLAIEPAQYVDLADGRLLLVKERVYTLLRDGACLLLPEVERSLLEARQLAAAIGRRHGQPTRASACLSFSAEAGGEARWLTEDAEIIQLIGRSRWLLYGCGIDDPLPGQDSASLAPVCPCVPVLDVWLEAGDVLALPRGWWHRRIADELPSAHLEVLIEPPTLHDFLAWVLARHAPARVPLRRRLVDDAAAQAAALGTAVEALRELLLEPALLADFRRARALAERPPPEFELAWLAGQQALAAETPLRLATAQAPVRSADTLRVNGCALAADSPAADLLREIAEQPSITVGALAQRQPALTPEALHDALLDLSAHGLLVIGGARFDAG
jgi:hypothetical protein